MPPIKVALIGLSQSAKTSWASQAHLPYLLSERGRDRYKIVALLNSSEDAARRSIGYYNLDSDVKAYGSPQELAADENVELVICTTRVDVHYDTIKPSVEAGKACFVEWPLAENVQRATELATTAKHSGARTMLGLQARVAPSILKVKALLENGTIGKVLSSEVQAATPFGGGDSMSEGLAYFLDKKVGGNPVTIAYGHMIDYIHFVLGEFETSHSQTQIQRPNQTIISESGATRSTISDVPDLTSTHGRLVPSEYVTEGALLSVTFRSGPPFPGTLPLIWTITGEKGQIRITSERGPFIQSEASGQPIPIEVYDNATKKTTNLEWKWEDWQESLPVRSKSIAKLYELFYDGRLAEYGACGFEDAVKRHAELDAILYQE